MPRKFSIIFFFEAVLFFCFYLLPPLQLYLHFQLQNFDYGILFQATRLLSEAKPLFLTVRGVHALADNQEWLQFVFSVAHYMREPHYWLLAMHSLAIYLCGLVVFWIFRSDKALGLLLPAFVWLSPFLININLDVFHTEAVATVLLLLMFAAARAGKPTLFILCTVLSLMCKEDVAVTVGAFCLIAWYQPERWKLSRRIFLFGGIAAAAMFCVNLFVVLPHYKLATCQWIDPSFDTAQLEMAPVAPFFRNTFHNIVSGDFYIERFSRPDVWLYVVRLLWPLLFVLGRPSLLWLLPLPAMLINILADTDYLVQGYYHYDHSTFAVLLIALLTSLEKCNRRTLISVLLVCSVFAQHLLGDQGLRVHIQEVLAKKFWTIEKDPRVATLEQLNATLPADLVISADYTSLNYLLNGHDQVYMLANPFHPEAFGIYGLCERLANPPQVDVIIVRENYQIKGSALPILQNLFQERFRKDGIIVYVNRYSRYQLTS